MNFNIRNNQKSGTSIERDNRNHILAPPNYMQNREYIVSAYEMELDILNYKNFKNYTQDVKHNRQVNYFRSSLQKRIIGCHLIKETLNGNWTLQSEIFDIYQITRSLISKIFKECIEEGWFISKICYDHQQQKCYKVSNELIERSVNYNYWKYLNANNSKFIKFVKNYNNFLLNTISCSKKNDISY